MRKRARHKMSSRNKEKKKKSKQPYQNWLTLSKFDHGLWSKPTFCSSLSKNINKIGDKSMMRWESMDIVRISKPNNLFTISSPCPRGAWFSCKSNTKMSSLYRLISLIIGLTFKIASLSENLMTPSYSLLKPANKY